MNVDEKILEKAHELFVKKGIRSVTMDELAQALGISKRTIYVHFSDKGALVEEDAKRFYVHMKKETDELINGADNVIQGVARVLMFVKGMMQTIVPMYFLEMKRYYPTAFEQISQNQEMRKSDVSKVLITRGVEEGLFRDNINIDLVSFFFNGVVLTDHEVMCEIPGLSYGDFERDVLFAYLSGIATAKGRDLIEQEQEGYFNQMNMFGVEIPKLKF